MRNRVYSNAKNVVGGRGRLTHAILISLAALLSAPLIGHLRAPPVFAECNPNRIDDGKHYWTGTSRFNLDPGPDGVRARIKVLDTWVKPGAEHAVVSWVMLFKGAGNWGQVGWFEFDSNERYTFVQHTLPGGFDTRFFPPEPVGSLTRYGVEFFPASEVTPAAFAYYVNDFEIWSSEASFTPNSSQIAAEITTLASQMPGEVGAKEHFHANEIRISGNSSYELFNGNVLNSDSNYFGSEKIDGSHSEVWDKC